MTTVPHVVGYAAIAARLRTELGRAVDERTVKRWSHADAEKRPAGLRQRLPVFKYPDGRVYLLEADLTTWVKAWRTPLPTGGALPGKAA